MSGIAVQCLEAWTGSSEELQDSSRFLLLFSPLACTNVVPLGQELTFALWSSHTHGKVILLPRLKQKGFWFINVFG